jgi:hypothetical protein
MQLFIALIVAIVVVANASQPAINNVAAKKISTKSVKAEATANKQLRADVAPVSAGTVTYSSAYSGTTCTGGTYTMQGYTIGSCNTVDLPGSGYVSTAAKINNCWITNDVVYYNYTEYSDSACTTASGGMQQVMYLSTTCTGNVMAGCVANTVNSENVAPGAFSYTNYYEQSDTTCANNQVDWYAYYLADTSCGGGEIACTASPYFSQNYEVLCGADSTYAISLVLSAVLLSSSLLFM